MCACDIPDMALAWLVVRNPSIMKYNFTRYSVLFKGNSIVEHIAGMMSLAPWTFPVPVLACMDPFPLAKIGPSPSSSSYPLEPVP